MSNCTPKTNCLDQVKQILSDEFIRETSFQLWEAHLEWLHKLGFKDALRQEVQGVCSAASFGHEVVDLLSQFVCSTGYVNAHLGLTSSDIIDNVRLMQVDAAITRLDQKASEVAHCLRQLDSLTKTVGFTHWQPAAPICWSQRVDAWFAPISLIRGNLPIIHAKQFGGPVGDSASLEIVLGDWPEYQNFDWMPFGLEQPENRTPLQSSDYLDETAAINWCCALAAQLHKIAQDLRFLASQGLVRIITGVAGSSSMPHKVNPYKWEKVCSICRSVSSTQSEIWSVMAQNSLERTLDGSWQIKALLRRCFEGLALALDEFCAVRMTNNVQLDTEMLIRLHDQLSTDEVLTRRVVEGGESRWAAYLDMLNHKSSEKSS